MPIGQSFLTKVKLFWAILENPKKSSMIYQILFQIGEIWLVYLQGFNYFNAIYDWLTIDLDHVIQIIISEQTAA